MTTQLTSLYVIAESPSGPVKIGISRTPLARVSTLQTGNPRPLALMHRWVLDNATALAWEKRIHLDLAEWKLEGEWFAIHPRIAGDFVQRFYMGEAA